LIPAVIAAGVAAAPLDTAVNIAFPSITGGFDKPTAAIQWVIICYVLTYSSAVLVFGRIADIIGHRKIFIIGLAWSIVALGLCAAAQSFGWLLFARSLQGFGAALILATGPALATLAFPESERGKAVGIYTMFFSVASAAGPLLGGALVDAWDWPAVFWFRIPIAMIALVLTLRFIDQPIELAPNQAFDYVGAVTWSIGLVSLLLAVNRGNQLGWNATLTVTLAVVAFATLCLFVWNELRADQPVLDLRLFGNLGFSTANIAHILTHMASFGVLLLGPYYLVRFADIALWQSGLLLALSPIAMTLASPVSGWLITRLPSLWINALGIVLATLGLWQISFWSADTPLAILALGLALQGFGVGIFQVANMDYVMGAIPRQQRGVAGSLNMVTRTIGVVTCAGVGSLLFALYRTEFESAGGYAPNSDQGFLLAYDVMFTIAACICALAVAAIAIAIVRDRLRQRALLP
jgi:EmrB/QacA subfamily drug resistance transporter